MNPDIIILGCSLSFESPDNDKGWARELRKAHPDKVIKNYAQPGRGNPLQSVFLNNYIYTLDDITTLKNTTIIWQIASPFRPLLPHDIRFTPMKSEWNKTLLVGDPYPEIIPMQWTPRFLDTAHPFLFKNIGYLVNKELNIRELVCDMVKWSYFVKNILVINGWSTFFEDINIQDILDPLYKRTNINVIETPIIDHVLDNGYALDDTMHPTSEGYESWYKTCLEPSMN